LSVVFCNTATRAAVSDLLLFAGEKEKYYRNNRDMCLAGTFALPTPTKLKGRSTAAIMVMATNGATSANCF
jgi:hypothetical protein